MAPATVGAFFITPSKQQYMELLTLNRKGWIDTDLTSSNQCKDIGHGKYSYQVSITCPADNTDDQEFIIDNSVVHRSIIECFQTSMSSCEGMVKKVASCLMEKCKEHGINILKMTVTIKPRGVEEHSFAWFDYTYVNPQYTLFNTLIS